MGFDLLPAFHDLNLRRIFWPKGLSKEVNTTIRILDGKRVKTIAASHFSSDHQWHTKWEKMHANFIGLFGPYLFFLGKL